MSCPQCATLNRRRVCRTCAHRAALVRADGILERYHQLGTLQKVADEYGLTRERIRQLCGEARRERERKAKDARPDSFVIV